MKDKKKIILLSHLWPYSPQRLTPSTGIYVYEQVEELKKNVDLEIFVPVKINPSLKEIFFSTKRNIFKKHIFYKEKSCIFLKYPKILTKHFDSFIIGVILYLKTYFKRYDLIHSHTLFPDGLASFVYSRLKKIPFVVTVHGSDLMLISERPLDKFFIKLFLKKARKVIVVSSKMEKILRDDFHIKRTIVIRNGIKREFKMTDLSKNLLFIGRLTDVKDPILLLEIFNDFLKSRKDFKLVIVGDGPLREKIFENIEMYGIKDYVDFKGFVKRDEIENIYSKTFLTLITSKSEGFPTIIFESFSAGVPIISFDVGGVKEAVIDYKTGFIVSKRDKGIFLKRVQEGVDYKWDREYIKKFASNFLWEKIAKEIVEGVYK